MQLSDERIRDFIEAWKSDFGETLTDANARSEAMRLLDFFATLAEAASCPPAPVIESDDGAKRSP